MSGRTVLYGGGGCLTCGVQVGEGRGDDPGGGVPGEPHGAVPGPAGGQEEGGGQGVE